jgi:chromosomal replication initiation ATPase DnaA
MEDAISETDEFDAAARALEMQAKQADANVVLVHGAFGCGKSYLLVSIIRYIATLLDEVQENETKILVCALTNVAVDRILLTLKE